MMKHLTAYDQGYSDGINVYPYNNFYVKDKDRKQYKLGYNAGRDKLKETK